MRWRWYGLVMSERTVWVTGASRGIGRGIAVALGRAGWVVYVTARSSSRGRTSHLPGTVEETAKAITDGGGTGIPVVCDHRDDDAVAAVAERIGRAHGHLNMLVNNAWGGYERVNAGEWQEWTAPFWQQPTRHFDDMFSGGVRAHYLTTALCVPLLLRAPGSMIVTLSAALTPGDSPGGVAYAMAKAADDALAAGAARQLAGQEMTSVALHPDWVRTEGVMQFADKLDLSGSQSPEGVGRAIAALADDHERTRLTGQVVTVADLARRYGVDVTT
jgi:NAD(P)-dependent dehydrogenase (short-subunit alcohol dehydrogenase family)